MKKLNNLGVKINESPKRIVKIASEARNRIQKRTNKGLDYNNTPMQRLDPDYAEYKKGKGKRGIPDLHFEGHMLRAMQVEPKGTGADIYFNNEAERQKAYKHHFGRGHMPARKFFMLGSKLRKYINTEIHKPIKKAIGA